MKAANKEALFHITKRDAVSRKAAWGIRGAALLAALLLCALFIYKSTGLNPLNVYVTMYQGAFGNSIYAWDTLIAAAKLLGIAVALAPAFMMRFWNIGAEGQFLIGGLATAYVMVNYGGKLPNGLLIVIMLLAAVFFGGLWGFLPAVCKAKWKTNETLFTLMMNYVSIRLTDYYYNIWKGAKSSLGKLNRATKAGYLPSVFGKSDMLNIIVVVLLAILMFIYLKKTKHGYEIAVVGDSENTARYAGMNVKKIIIRTMILSGAVCGLGGFLTVAGREHTVSSVSTAGGYGFTAIIVAWLSKFNTLYMALVSVFIVFLENGTKLIADTYSSFNDSASSIIIGVILFFVIGSEFFINYKVNFRHKEAAKA